MTMSDQPPSQWPQQPTQPLPGQYPPQQYPPGGHPGQQYAPPAKVRKGHKRWIIPTCTAFAGLVFGTAIGGGSAADTTAAGTTSTVTVTQQAGQQQPSKDLAAREAAVRKREVDVAARESKAQTAEAKPAEQKSSGAASFTDGVYIVGSDIQPGSYRSKTPGDNCYWARLKNTDGGLDSIIASEWETNGGQQLVTIKRTDKAFKTSDCGTWEQVK